MPDPRTTKVKSDSTSKMRQQRITDFFPRANGVAAAPAAAAASPVVPNLMRLPPNVRRAIYNLAGLEQEAIEPFIDLNCWRNRQPDTLSQDDWCGDIESKDLEKSPDGYSLADVWKRVRLRVNWRRRIPINLLHLSRTIHDEVEEALYVSRIWGVSASGAGGLDVLENLSPKAMKAIRCLLISLTPCGCSSCFLSGVCTNPIPTDLRLYHSVYDPWFSHFIEPSGCPWSEREGGDAYRNERPLDIRLTLDRRTTAQWDRICQKLEQSAELQRLSLYVHCVVKDFRTAERIATPLRQLHSLKDLGISFGRRKKTPASHDEQLSALARATVEAAKYQPSFPFFDLPTELQLQVLGFTHIVNDGYEVKYFDKRPVLNRLCDGGSEHVIPQFSRLEGHYAWLLSEVFCAKTSMAFRGRCCHCNAVPVSYFLVSKQFRALALELFYGRNRILAAYNNISWCTVAALEPSGGVRTRTATPHVLHHLTRLTLVASIRRNVSATVEFTRLVELLRTHARLPSLTLELHVRDAHGRDDVVAALQGIPGARGEARRRRRHTEI
ncbi:hypothetical protein B0T26DRAFT_434712 [Lasiosphaeria miniovina]|uniref:F-box domain-containing protein n=1 Tax=Lasiosphaeria miniovina TaxID=1954250 RepID=A0AA40A6R4_9PEZI|nr:uncharacterized protein B0T26DRAFT_434712 [Lasiosphaeria miniovina]KAK0710260.1 hypothetical protein B0T26DRAFT_434712 [Lasiosphaeria miniovina]